MEEIRCLVDREEIKKGRCLYIVKQISNPEKNCSDCLYYQKLREIGFDPNKGLPPKILMGFTRYPPDGDIPIEEVAKFQAYVNEMDIDVGTFLILLMSEHSFKESENPFEALRTFIISHEAGLYPPIWAIDWLTKELKEYQSSTGKRSLEQLLGFRGGKGQDPIFKKMAEQDRDEVLMFDIFRLHKFAGYSVKEAAGMVAGRLEKTPNWNKTGLKLKPIKGGTLEKEYSRKWSSIFEKLSNESIEGMAKEFNKKRRTYLKLFPRPSKRK